MAELLLATNNQGKILEYRELLSGCGFELIIPAERGIDIAIAETGKTFAENATKKAQAYSAASGLPALADDSGLEVDALCGAPGVRSARYAGEGASDTERNALLLANLRHVPLSLRTARFRCVIAIAEPSGSMHLADGVIEGLIALTPRGTSGFGYDPIFYLPERHLTIAELEPVEKNRISHRAAAAAKACLILRSLSAENNKER
jgi:XTP/dITP diphosphohydrolase